MPPNEHFYLRLSLEKNHLNNPPRFVCVYDSEHNLQTNQTIELNLKPQRENESDRYDEDSKENEKGQEGEWIPDTCREAKFEKSTR